MASVPSKRTDESRVDGLDALRLIAALIVLLGHFSPPWPGFLGDDAVGWARALRGVMSCLYNGPAAVIVFFVISGFCIHFRQREGRRLDVVPYLVRRILRIGLPAMAAVALCLAAGCDLGAPNYGVFWSIVCEVGYYLLYPFLLALRQKAGWELLIAASTALCVWAWSTHIQALRDANGSCTALGNLTWLNGLPCWLLGCWLAENLVPAKAVNSKRIWCWRVFIILCAVGLRITKFHVHHLMAGNFITLNVFALLVVPWIRHEIAWRRSVAAPAFLERAGLASYSLYLTHAAVPYLLHKAGFEPGGSFLGWLMLTATCLAFAFVFYLVIELPSLALARKAASKLTPEPVPRQPRVAN